MRKLMFVLLFGVMAQLLSAQETVYQISEVTVINYGDGRFLFRQSNDAKAPLQGLHRIIDGYHSEYLLAGFKDGMYDGKYQHFKRNNLIEESNYKEGRLEGMRKKFYADGKTLQSEATFVDGKLNGMHKTYFQNGNLETEKGYKLGVEDGPDRRYNHDTGKLALDTYYKDGKKEGKWVEHIFSSSRGDYIEISNYKDGLPAGEYLKTLENGVVLIKGTYKDGKKEGVWVTNRKNGLPETSTTYRNDKKNGEEKTYFEDGKLAKIANYLDGKLDGIVKEYHYETGKLRTEYTYKSGVREGGYKRYSDAAKLAEEGRYEGGSEVYHKEYYPDGKVKLVEERSQNGSWKTLERY